MQPKPWGLGTEEASQARSGLRRARSAVLSPQRRARQSTGAFKTGSRLNVAFSTHFRVLPQLPPRYTALNDSYSSQEAAIMTLRAVEEVPTQVPADDFQALEEKVYRTIELYKSAREARSTAERDVKRLREQLEEREEEVETLRREMVRLRKERAEDRGSVEKMLAQIETLSEEQVAS